MPLRLLIYDATPNEADKWLRRAWASGARVYRALGRLDAYHGASSWSDALQWLISRGPEPIGEVQFWGHGRWGRALIGSEDLSEASFERSHEHRDLLLAVREHLLPGGDSLVWFRTCETFGCAAGQSFAARVSRELATRVAGHTYAIAAVQSGLHGLRHGEAPHWPADEGLAEGSPEAPITAKTSSVNAPHTIHFMNGRVPQAWFDR